MIMHITAADIWNVKFQVIRDSQHLRIVKQKDVHAYRSIIIIKGVKKEDEGQYEVIVKNREGEARNQITLKVTVSFFISKLLWICLNLI